jgi:hypothetical protein
MKFKKKHIYFMTRSINFFIVFLFITICVHGQDLFNEENTSKFADYLFKTQQYNLAAQEYERLVFLAPSKANYKLSLIQSYRYAGDLTSAQKRILLFFGDSLFNINQTFGTEYLKVELLQGNLAIAQNFIKQSSKLDENTKQHYQTCIYLMKSQWHKADSVIKGFPGIDQPLVKLTDKAMHMKYKSPALAAVFSTILPGSGKAYCSYWKDGLISLLFVSANAWQAYRGYTKFGPNSAHFYVFGSLTVGFYLGNIYGSLKAAKRHNKIANDKIHHESENFILSTF